MRAAALVNRALQGEDWARERLSGHAGRRLRIVAGPAKATLAINPDGSFTDAHDEADLTLTISPLRLPLLLAHPERWNALVGATGDAGLASTIGELAQTLPWFVERAFSRAFGSILGQEFADAGRRLLTLPGYAAERTGASIASYVSEEAAVAAGARAGSEFAGQVAALAERVDALGERVDRLDAASPRTSS